MLTMIVTATKDPLRFHLESLLRSQLQWIHKNLLSKFRCMRKFRRSIKGRKRENSLRRRARKLVNTLNKRRKKSQHLLAGNLRALPTDSISLIIQRRRRQRRSLRNLNKDLLKMIFSHLLIKAEKLVSILILEVLRYPLPRITLVGLNKNRHKNNLKRITWLISLTF
jgi:hypothetical protein